jgi:LuxR family maltose regulon positive regulatory protein
VQGIELLIQIKWYLSKKMYPQALVSMEAFRREPGNYYGLAAFLFGKVTLNAIEAVCRYYTGETETAFRSLETAYAAAESNGLDMPFIELGWDMRSLAEAALRGGSSIPQSWLEKIQRNASAYGKKLLIAAEQQNRDTPEKPPVVLPRREMKVLADLSRGLTREDIAEEEALSVYAVKGLIKIIYDKLGAVNRADAIRIATAMGMFKSPIK